VEAEEDAGRRLVARRRLEGIEQQLALRSRGDRVEVRGDPLRGAWRRFGDEADARIRRARGARRSIEAAEHLLHGHRVDDFRLESEGHAKDGLQLPDVSGPAVPGEEQCRGGLESRRRLSTRRREVLTRQDGYVLGALAERRNV
jgi:hypothetical protein